MNDSHLLDTPRKKQKSLISKIFGQISIQNEDIERSIYQKETLIEEYNACPGKLQTFAGNYILTDRQTIVDATEKSLRSFLKPIEERQRQISSAQNRRSIEIKDAGKRKQAELELCQRAEEKQKIAMTQFNEIVQKIQEKIKQLEADGYAE